MLAIDADSHFVEPLNLFERRIDTRFRDRAYKVEKDPATGMRQLVVDKRTIAFAGRRGTVERDQWLRSEGERSRPQQL
jgi:hypothetical protein